MIKKLNFDYSRSTLDFDDINRKSYDAYEILAALSSIQ